MFWHSKGTLLSFVESNRSRLLSAFCTDNNIGTWGKLSITINTLNARAKTSLSSLEGNLKAPVMVQLSQFRVLSSVSHRINPAAINRACSEGKEVWHLSSEKTFNPFLPEMQVTEMSYEISQLCKHKHAVENYYDNTKEPRIENILELVRQSNAHRHDWWHRKVRCGHTKGDTCGWQPWEDQRSDNRFCTHSKHNFTSSIRDCISLSPTPSRSQFTLFSLPMEASECMFQLVTN